ncbi:MAG: acyl-CoA dehydrogenase family protein [Candidatus Binatia bacterium]
MAMEQVAYEALRKDIFAAIWREIDPLEREIEDTEHIPHDKLWPALTGMRAFALLIPEQWGGLGLSVSQYVPIIAEFGKTQGGIRALVHVHNSMCHALSALGTPAQCVEVLPAAARGEKSVAFALTEPDYGTGADLGSRATKVDGGWAINGRKHLITNSDFASHFMVFAKTGDREVSCLLTPRTAPGLKIEVYPHTMGAKGGAHGLLTFTECFVPDSAVMGDVGKGLDQLEEALEISRVFVAASSLGTAEYALELSVARAKQRVTFKKPIAERQAIQRYLAEMATDVYALRLMLADVAARWDRGERIPAQASMTKLFGLEAVGRVTDRALLVFGGIGYTRAHKIERLYRDARLNWLEEGTPTIQQLVIARQVIAGFRP